MKKGNEIGVFVWTSPDINSSPPIAVEVIEKNGGTSVFKGPTPQGPGPNGAFTSEARQRREIRIKFDDSNRM